ncbi:DUF2171 domain-containing protein [Roseomonas indoligenes]|uniref:DUF2171 domain-containing protein n=1 Tax=Roseomonas indoligenes TaxID=2820811 RepID=A0A940MZZ1_9PROT|nr:DUF2171 domain-containing protein [Pararoseomonas indoligenes]MBP0492755.1 DUF2171 domain-containing protein [Pararoseomonas indoligenes]
MANADKLAAGEIADRMPVIGSGGEPFGIVDHVEGDFIKLAKSDPTSGGVHRYIPRSTVAGLDGGVVRLSMPAEQAKGSAAPRPACHATCRSALERRREVLGAVTVDMPLPPQPPPPKDRRGEQERCCQDRQDSGERRHPSRRQHGRGSGEPHGRGIH